MTDQERAVMQQALEDLKDLHKNHNITCAGTIAALEAALAQQEQTCNCRWVGDVQTQQCTLHEAHVDAIHEWAERAKTAEAALAQQEQATVKESLPVGQEEPEGGWQSAPSPQVTQRIADMPMSEYRRGVNDGFKLGLREGRIKAEDEMREQPEQEPVAWIQPDHLQKARQAPFLCRVEPTQRCADFVPFYTHPPRREWRGLTEEERNACLVEADPCECLADHEAKELMLVVEAALKERNA